MHDFFESDQPAASFLTSQGQANEYKSYLLTCLL